MKSQEEILAFVATIISNSYLYQKLTVGMQLILTVKANYQHSIELQMVVDLLQAKVSADDYTYINSPEQVKAIDKLLIQLAQSTMHHEYNVRHQPARVSTHTQELQDVLHTFPWVAKQYKVEAQQLGQLRQDINQYMLTGDENNPLIAGIASSLSNFQRGAMASHFWKLAKVAA